MSRSKLLAEKTEENAEDSKFDVSIDLSQGGISSHLAFIKKQMNYNTEEAKGLPKIPANR